MGDNTQTEVVAFSKIRYYGRLPEDYIGHDNKASFEVKTNKKIQIHLNSENAAADSPGGKVHSGWERAAESGMTRNTPPSAGKLKNHQGTFFRGRAGGLCELDSDNSKAEDNANVQIKPKVARVDHTLVGS